MFNESVLKTEGQTKRQFSQRQFRVTVLTVNKNSNQKHNPEVLKSIQISQYKNT